MIGYTNTRFANPYLPSGGEVEYKAVFREVEYEKSTSVGDVMEGEGRNPDKRISPGYGNGNADVRSPVFSAFSHTLLGIYGWLQSGTPKSGFRPLISGFANAA